jgi:hypothetical protein
VFYIAKDISYDEVFFKAKAIVEIPMDNYGKVLSLSSDLFSTIKLYGIGKKWQSTGIDYSNPFPAVSEACNFTVFELLLFVMAISRIYSFANNIVNLKQGSYVTFTSLSFTSIFIIFDSVTDDNNVEFFNQKHFIIDLTFQKSTEQLINLLGSYYAIIEKKASMQKDIF